MDNIITDGAVRIRTSFTLTKKETIVARNFGFKKETETVFVKTCSENAALILTVKWLGDDALSEFVDDLHWNHLLNCWGYPIDYLIVEYLSPDGCVTKIDF